MILLCIFMTTSIEHLPQLNERNFMNKRVLVLIGIILIIAQAVSFWGMSRMFVGLYPDNYDLLYPSFSTESSGLNIKKTLFAVNAGLDRFKSGFADLAYSKDDYRTMTAVQITSAMIRESLNCNSGGSFGLRIYDGMLTISYCLPGILGAILLVVASKSEE